MIRNEDPNPARAETRQQEDERLEELYGSTCDEYETLVRWCNICLAAVFAGCIVGVVWAALSGGLL